MTPKEMCVIVLTAIVVVGTIWYIWSALSGDKVKPVLASWIIIGCTMILSYATYWTAPKHSLAGNAFNAISVVSCVSIMIAAMWLNKKSKTSVVFSTFQKACLWLSFAIAIFWIVLVWGFGGTGTIPNILTQILMIIGYLVTAQKLWNAKRNSESRFTWWCITIAGVISIYTSASSDDSLAVLYAIRATIAAATIVWLMHRIDSKNKGLLALN